MNTASWASTALPPPASWAMAPQYPDGACRCCAHSTPCGTGLGCTSHAVAGRGQPVPVRLARQMGGACGIDAWHHTYQGHRPAPVAPPAGDHANAASS